MTGARVDVELSGETRHAGGGDVTSHIRHTLPGSFQPALGKHLERVIAPEARNCVGSVSLTIKSAVVQD